MQVLIDECHSASYLPEVYILRYSSKMTNTKLNYNNFKKESSTRFQVQANHAYNGAENRFILKPRTKWAMFSTPEIPPATRHSKVVQ